MRRLLTPTAPDQPAVALLGPLRRRGVNERLQVAWYKSLVKNPLNVRATDKTPRYKCELVVTPGNCVDRLSQVPAGLGVYRCRQRPAAWDSVTDQRAAGFVRRPVGGTLSRGGRTTRVRASC